MELQEELKVLQSFPFGHWLFPPWLPVINGGFKPVLKTCNFFSMWNAVIYSSGIWPTLGIWCLMFFMNISPIFSAVSYTCIWFVFTRVRYSNVFFPILCGFDPFNLIIVSSVVLLTVFVFLSKKINLILTCIISCLKIVGKTKITSFWGFFHWCCWTL